MIGEDYRRTPVKPVLDGEPRYEDHPVNWKPEEGGWFDDADVRQACYWALFSGAFGHTYGCHPIWQFATPDRPKVGLARHDWKEAMDFAGAAQMQHARALIESRDFLSRAPEPNVILNNPGEGGEHLAACRGDGYVMVYTPMGKPFALNLRRGRARLWYTSWFDPRTGAWTKGAEVSGSPERYEFTPPGTPGRGNDWILVLDSNAR
jgi:hypothetical protein